MTSPTLTPLPTIPRHHTLPPEETPCFNCAKPLLGPWCHCCGQSAHDYHRSTRHLAAEAFESLFHADGRLWRTLSRLIRNPARLTRDYLAGRRAPQIPPLRLFLVVLLILFLAANWASRNAVLFHLDQTPAEARAALQAGEIHLGLPNAWETSVTGWLHAHLGRALTHPDDLVSAMRDHAENFAFLMLPLSALILATIFAFRRGFVLFDHLVFSMHSLSFLGLLIVTVILTDGPLAGNASLLLWAAPVHLFTHMRGVYGTNIIGTLLRMAVLFTASTIAFSLLVLALVLTGLEGLRG